MTAILSVGNSEGTRRCDARCHQATEPDCDCICGGRYHGCGSTDLARQRLADDLDAGRLGHALQRAFRHAQAAEQAHNPRAAGQLTLEGVA